LNTDDKAHRQATGTATRDWCGHSPLRSDREPADRPSDAATEAIPMEQMERVGVAAPDYASGIGAAQLVVKLVMAD